MTVIVKIVFCFCNITAICELLFNKYVHDLVTIDTDFIDAWFNYETYLLKTFLSKAAGRLAIS